MLPSVLKKFNELVDISDKGDYEAHTVNGYLVANIGAFDQSGMISVSMGGVSEQLDIYTNCKMINKYLALFENNFDMKTSDDAILMSNDKLEILIPMISKEAATKSSRPLKNKIPYDNPLVFDLKKEAIDLIFKASKAQDDAILKFIMKEHMYVENGKVKFKDLKEVTGKEYIWCFSRDVIARMLGHVVDKVTFTFPYNDDLPVKLEYKTGQIDVVSYIMRTFPKEVFGE